MLNVKANSLYISRGELPQLCNPQYSHLVEFMTQNDMFTTSLMPPILVLTECYSKKL